MVEVDLDSFQEDKEQAEQSSPFFQLEDGQNIIRLMPPFSDFESRPVKSTDLPKYDRHYITRDGLDDLLFRCLGEKDEYCPACDAYSKFVDSDDPNYQDMAGDIKSKTRRLINIVDVQNPGDGIQVLSAHYYLWHEGAQIVNFAADPDYAGDIWDPYDGKNFVITQKSSSGKPFPSWNGKPQVTKTDITEDLPSGWKEDLDNLKDRAPDYEDPDTIIKAVQNLGLPFKQNEQVSTPSMGGAEEDDDLSG